MSPYYRKLWRELKPGVMIEDCGIHVCRVIYASLWYDEITFENVTRGPVGRGSCSPYNCGPVVLSPQMLEERMKAFEEKGELGLQERYYVKECKMSLEDATKYIEEFNKTWRNPT